MSRPRCSTPTTPTTPRSPACLDAREWVLGRLRWEQRLGELHALADLGETESRPEPRPGAEARSGVLEEPGRWEGVCA